MELDIDFENYSVPNERKLEVRSFVEALKQEPWVADVKTLVAELGVEDLGTHGEPALPGMLEETKARIYRAPEGTPAFGFEAVIQGSELKVYFERIIWMEIHFLPKGSEFLVFFVDENSFEDFKQKMIEIDELTKAAKGKKSVRAAEWKARFTPKTAKLTSDSVETT
jgi:hypothetical protein